MIRNIFIFGYSYRNNKNLSPNTKLSILKKEKNLIRSEKIMKINFKANK